MMDTDGRMRGEARGLGRRLPALAAIAGFLVGAAEMVFMSSPFAAYFYGFYSPILQLTERSPYSYWLSEFWVSHVFAPNPMLRAITWLGGVLVTAGLGLFIVHAVYLYRVKFRRKLIVDRLLYAYVRHPQYAALMLAGLGLALLWPRFVNLVMFLAMSAAYYALARWEETRMDFDFGDSYRHFAEGKAMFFPGNPGGRLTKRWLGWLPAGAPRVIVGAAALAAGTMAAAVSIRAYSLHSLRVLAVPGERGAVIVAYAGSLPEDAASALAPIARGASEAAGIRMLFVMTEKKRLRHLLVDSGVDHSTCKKLDLPVSDLYVVRAVVRGSSGAHGRDPVRGPSQAFGVTANRKLDGVFCLSIRAGRGDITEIALPAGAIYRHARVPLL